MHAFDVPLMLFDLAPSLQKSLIQAGFRNAKDLDGITSRELCNETGMTSREAIEVLLCLEKLQDEIDKVHQPIGQTARELLQEAEKIPKIPTRLIGLDRLLGGGLTRGEVMEICGGPGLGKTQFAIHVCLASSVPFKGRSIYIDSEGSFVIERVAQMAAHFVEDYKLPGEEISTRDDILRSIHYYRVHDYVEQMQVIQSLFNVLRQDPKICTLVIDSLAFHLRHSFEDTGARARATESAAIKLHELAREFRIVVFIVNYMTTKYHGDHRLPSAPFDTMNGLEIPALGDSWSHAIATRLYLNEDLSTRSVHLIKSSAIPPAHPIPYAITERGISVESPSIDALKV
uniref:DNA repair protein RAD51 homolog 3 n=1 Tax=Albugo laibachii Nc14 TaxID=890382 RepID=F0WP66_9STRA|nr:DNA repair protein RAD51 putative [Albugo laibachii Nc14]|eukprot:CCA23112.1 DNA repair protein RAD51 putative [Albugo laibachii Nc14]